VAPEPALAPGFYVNVGLFAVPGNASHAQKKLLAAKLPVLVDSIQRKNVALTRVRVGPLATRAKANAAAKKIQALKLAAVVFQV
jgi:cell division septation protein DedD